jgi:hypothetical protein
MNRTRTLSSVLTSVVSFALLCFTVNAAQAASIPLVDNNGVSAGWNVTVADVDANDVSLTFVSSSGNRFFFTKNATLRRNGDPLVISFDKVDPNAKELVIQNENLVNASGSDWTGFRTLVSSGSNGGSPNFSFVTSDNSAGLGTFDIDPFTSFTFLNQNTELFVNGGTVANGDTWSPGSTSGTGLAIVTSASTATHFTLKEIPIGGQGNNIIPLPAAAWSGLSMLLGLGLIGTGRKIYHSIF